MCFIYQRYDFESKSQLGTWEERSDDSCVLYTKGTILKANHNPGTRLMTYPLVVFYIPKVRFWKQITTSLAMRQCYSLLCFIYQRYDFESKSQLHFIAIYFHYCCVLYTKGTILKANHNLLCRITIWRIVVFYIPKVRFWKQIATYPKQNCPVKLQLHFIIYTFQAAWYIGNNV